MVVAGWGPAEIEALTVDELRWWNETASMGSKVLNRGK